MHGNSLLVEKLHHILMSVMIHVFALKWQPLWIFTCRVKTIDRLMIPLYFLYFKTWVCTAKYLFMSNIEKNYMISGCNNRESVAMAAILKKHFPPLGFLGLFTIVFSGHPSNFPENFSFLHFFPQVEP